MKSALNENQLTIFLEGRIDSSNANDIGNEIDSIRNENKYESLVLDFEKLEYISSAGLRQILRLKKEISDLHIINVNGEVYDILEMTGFTEMIDITKAFRTVDISNCELIGSGSNGKVYRLDEENVIKVYKPNASLDDITREKDLARTALIMGINTAISYDVVKVGDCYGSVFEMLKAKSISKWILGDHDHLGDYVKVFSDFLKEIHSTVVTDEKIPDQKKIVLHWAEFLEGYIDDEHYNKLIRLINEVPDDNHLIHGDYHTSNVHYDGKEAILLDMDTIARGNPVFEFGALFNTYKGFGISNPDTIIKYLKLDIITAYQILDLTFRNYFNSNEYYEQLIKAKIVGFTRLLRRTIKREPENTIMIESIKAELLDSLDRCDSLAL